MGDSKLKGWIVSLCERKEIRDFIETHHYSKSINGCIADFCFKIEDETGVIKGAMFYGRMAMANQWKRFSDTPENIIELRRLCCIDDTPKNTESFFIGATLKILKKEWRRDGVVVSYADKEYGHGGIIYKASNFFDFGDVKGAKVIIHEGRRYHDKTIRTKYKGELKPFARRIKEALNEGSAYYKKTAGKKTFIYHLDKKKRVNYVGDT